MQLNITFDQDLSYLPAGFVNDVEYVANLFDSLFTNNVTINFDVGFGEVRGVKLDPDFIGEPDPTNYYTESYDAVRAALIAQGAPGASGLPLTSPLRGSLRLSQAQAKALGFAADAGVDAYVGFSATTDWSYAIPGQPDTGTIAPGQNECVSLIEHEFAEAMGRRSDLQGEITYANGAINYGIGQPSYYTPMDLYRYRAPGVIDTPFQENYVTAYFSLDGGVSQLGIFDTLLTWLDHGDWYPNGPTADGNDAFNGFPKAGVPNPISQTDLLLMSAIGWTVNHTTNAQTVAQFTANQATLDLNPTGFNIADLASTLVGDLAAIEADGHVAALTFTDATPPVLTLTLAQALALPPITNANYTIKIIDTAANLQALTPAQIATLAAEHFTTLTSTDSNMNFTPTQGDALKAGGLQVVTPAGDHVRVGYSDGTAKNWYYGPNGVLTKLRDVHADGSVDVDLYTPGIFHGVNYAYSDTHATAAGFIDKISFDDVHGVPQATELLYSIGGGQTHADIALPDGTHQLITTGVTGQTYKAYSNDVTSSFTQLAHSLDNVDGSGNLRLLGSNLVVSTSNQTVGQASAPSEFTFNNHAVESFQFVLGTNNRFNFDAAGFGAATVSGFGVAATNDIVDISHLFASFADAQGAMTQMGADVVITEGTDTITLQGVQKSSLTAGQLGY